MFIFVMHIVNKSWYKKIFYLFRTLSFSLFTENFIVTVPSWLQLSLEKLYRKPATRRFD